MIVNSSEPAKLPAPPVSVHDGCPFLGLADDAKTRLLFPAADAVCHLAKPSDEVDTAYQQTTCLTAGHQTCVVFLRPKPGPLPPEISVPEGQRVRPRRLWAGLIVILLLVLVAVWSGLWWGNGRGNGRGPLTALNPTGAPTRAEVVVAPSAAAPSAAASATASPTLPPPKPTLPPTSTPTAVPTEPPTIAPTATALLPSTYTPRAVPPTPSPTATPEVRANVIVPRLNVRQGPGVMYDAIALVDEGSQFAIIGRVPDGSWLQICCVAGAAGWVITESVLVDGDVTAVPVNSDIPPPPTTTP